MKTLKYTFLSLSLCGGILSSCTGFFDTTPYDELSPSTFWKTPDDANDALVACYNDWIIGSDILFADCMSDIGYIRSSSGGYRYVGNGSASQANTVSYYDYTTIRRCNTFLLNIDKVSFPSEDTKKDLVAQVRTIRAYRYFLMNFWYGGVPLILDLPQTADDAKLPRDTEENIKSFVYKELDEAIPDLKTSPAKRGQIARGAALAIKMRAALYWGDYQQALDAATSIRELNLYELDTDFLNIFSIKGQNSREIIYAVQYVENTHKFENAIRLYNNRDGGWASMVPTENLVNMFEMANGLLPHEAGSGYDPIHPYAGRDPRLGLTIVYPGQEWLGSDGKKRIVNTLDKVIDGKNNTDYYLAADNASRTGLTWAKYTTPRSQYGALNDTGLCPILFRYAEVLLTIAEANVELNRNFDEVFNILDQLRLRGGHIAIDRSRYTTQSALRELVRRERCLELAGEGLRRADIVRWKDEKGKMVAETVLNQTLCRMIGTVDVNESDPTRRAVITPSTEANLSLRKIEDRVFKPAFRYLPIPQSQHDKNPNLTPTPGYEK